MRGGASPAYSVVPKSRELSAPKPLESLLTVGLSSNFEVVGWGVGVVGGLVGQLIGNCLVGGCTINTVMIKS